MAIENLNFLPIWALFDSYKAYIRPIRGRKFDFWSNFLIKTKNKFN